MTGNLEKMTRKNPSREVVLNKNSNNSIGVRNFFKFLGVCHSVMVDHDPETGEASYQSSSPDELALVDASSMFLNLLISIINRLNKYLVCF